MTISGKNPSEVIVDDVANNWGAVARDPDAELERPKVELAPERGSKELAKVYAEVRNPWTGHTTICRVC